MMGQRTWPRHADRRADSRADRGADSRADRGADSVANRSFLSGSDWICFSSFDRNFLRRCSQSCAYVFAHSDEAPRSDTIATLSVAYVNRWHTEHGLGEPTAAPTASPTG